MQEFDIAVEALRQQQSEWRYALNEPDMPLTSADIFLNGAWCVFLREDGWMAVPADIDRASLEYFSEPGFTAGTGTGEPIYFSDGTANAVDIARWIMAQPARRVRYSDIGEYDREDLPRFLQDYRDGYRHKSASLEDQVAALRTWLPKSASATNAFRAAFSMVEHATHNELQTGLPLLAQAWRPDMSASEGYRDSPISREHALGALRHALIAARTVAIERSADTPGRFRLTLRQYLGQELSHSEHFARTTGTMLGERNHEKAFDGRFGRGASTLLTYLPELVWQSAGKTGGDPVPLSISTIAEETETPVEVVERFLMELSPSADCEWWEFRRRPFIIAGDEVVPAVSSEHVAQALILCVDQCLTAQLGQHYTDWRGAWLEETVRGLFRSALHGCDLLPDNVTWTVPKNLSVEGLTSNKGEIDVGVGYSDLALVVECKAGVLTAYEPTGDATDSVIREQPRSRGDPSSPC